MISFRIVIPPYLDHKFTVKEESKYFTKDCKKGYHNIVKFTFIKINNVNILFHVLNTHPRIVQKQIILIQWEYCVSQNARQGLHKYP